MIELDGDKPASATSDAKVPDGLPKSGVGAGKQIEVDKAKDTINSRVE